MKIKQIIFCTLRDNRGATGGPGGVLYIQKNVLGNEINKVPCKYQFNIINLRLGPIKTLINKWLFYLKFRHITDAYFFTHDIETGGLLAHLGKRYSILYHHQGPIIQELTNFGKKLGNCKKKRLTQIEHIALSHAQSLHFPSTGAANMYFTSQYAACNRNEVNLGKPFYNIIPQVNPTKPNDFELDFDDNFITLFSLGTLTSAKGQDLTIRFIHKHINAFSKPLRYIIVGRGPLKNQLLSELDKIKKENPSFIYHYYESLPHETVMLIHKISDIYIMLHRISIFDFATLEAMSQHSAIILSKIGGNLDFDMNSNIIFAEDVEANESILIKADFPSLKENNYNVFNCHFSKEAFVNQYKEFFEQMLVKEK